MAGRLGSTYYRLEGIGHERHCIMLTEVVGLMHEFVAELRFENVDLRMET